MNAVWIALIAAFSAMIPIFVFVAKQTQQKMTAAKGVGDSAIEEND